LEKQGAELRKAVVIPDRRTFLRPGAVWKLFRIHRHEERSTHALIRNLPRASRSSQTPGLQKNDDGSVDVYFGPKAPAGKESNWVPKSTDGIFEVLFRLYGPEKPLFDKMWKLPDVERITAQ
jgi:hypothetical protein